MPTAAPIKRKDIDPLRRFNTPECASLALLDKVNIDGVVLEPCAGERRISNVIESHLSRQPLNPHRDRRVVTADLDRAVSADLYADATNPYSWSPTDDGMPDAHRYGAFDWCVTNPEFSIAHHIVPAALQAARIAVAFLLRLTWLEPCEGRDEFLKAHPPDHLIVLPRISFKTVYRLVKASDAPLFGEHGKVKKSTTDSATCAWLVWYKFKVVPRIDIVTDADLKAYGLNEEQHGNRSFNFQP